MLIYSSLVVHIIIITMIIMIMITIIILITITIIILQPGANRHLAVGCSQSFAQLLPAPTTSLSSGLSLSFSFMIMMMMTREPMEKRNAEPDLGGHQLSITR